MYVDYKATIWCRIKLDHDVDLTKVIETIEKGSVYDLFEMEEYTHYEAMHDTEEFITPEENNGQSTIEIYKDTELIYSNKE